jgi:hypothetical protein
MANEIGYVAATGATLTYGAYQPDGTARTAPGTSLPEIASTGYYTASDALLTPGDWVVVSDGAGVVAGWRYEGATTLAEILVAIQAIPTSQRTLIVSRNEPITSNTALIGNL